MSTDFLPVSRKDMEERGIEQLDFVYVIGDAYVRPSVVRTCHHQSASGGTWLPGGDHFTARLEG